MILLLIAFILLLAWVTLANGKADVVIPAASTVLVEKLVQDLSGSAIPEFVITYGTLII